MELMVFWIFLREYRDSNKIVNNDNTLVPIKTVIRRIIKIIIIIKK